MNWNLALEGEMCIQIVSMNFVFPSNAWRIHIKGEIHGILSSTLTLKFVLCDLEPQLMVWSKPI